MACEYVRQYYGVPAEIGRRIIHNGKPGVVAEDKGHYIGVNFDDDEPCVIYPVHPTDQVEYLGMGAVRKKHANLSKKKAKAKQRYQRYHEYGDCFHSFIDFCRWDAHPDHSWNAGA